MHACLSRQTVFVVKETVAVQCSLLLHVPFSERSTRSGRAVHRCSYLRVECQGLSTVETFYDEKVLPLVRDC